MTSSQLHLRAAARSLDLAKKNAADASDALDRAFRAQRPPVADLANLRDESSTLAFTLAGLTEEALLAADLTRKEAGLEP